MADKLDIGDVLPRMTLNIVGGRPLTFPERFEGRYNILIFYRGHW